MVKLEGHRIIRVPVQKVFQLVSRLEAHPHVTGLWMTADLIDRRADTLTVHYKGYFAGMPVESVQRATLHPPNRIEFRQTRGALKAFQGQYVLKPIEGDTELTMSIEADVGIALISEASARLVLHSFIERSLEKFKLMAERDLPRVQRRPHELVAAPAPAEAAEAEPEKAQPQPEPPPPAAPTTEAGAAPPGKKRRRRRRRRRRRGGGGPEKQGPGPA